MILCSGDGISVTWTWLMPWPGPRCLTSTCRNSWGLTWNPWFHSLESMTPISLLPTKETVPTMSSRAQRKNRFNKSSKTLSKSSNLNLTNWLVSTLYTLFETHRICFIHYLLWKLREFKEKSKVDRVVVLWTANTERYSNVAVGLNDTEENLLASLDRNEAEISPSTLFAIACVMENVPFINGSPQNTFVPGFLNYDYY